tara:strand:+ start:684 stop:1205 length:522 start_codon:yes stop_codon:yes gene_type:complete
MAWQGQMSTMLRHIINDVDVTNYTFSNKRLETTLLVAAQLVRSEMDFSNDYSINVESCQLDPDPTDSSTQENDFVTLVVLKAACIVVGSEVRSESTNAISIKDGPSAIDLRGVSNTLVVLYKDLCSKYEKAVLDYRAGRSIAGNAILGPYSPGSDFVSRTHSDYDHRGNYFRY